MWKPIVITFIMITLFVGCSNSENGNTISKPSSEMNSNDTNVPNDKDTSSDMQKYIDFIQDDHDELVTFIAKEDIDLDGYDEIVLAFGSSNEDPQLGYVSGLYILRDINGDIVQLGDNLAESAYGTFEVKLIKLQNKRQTYIYCGLTNGGGLVGFQIYGLSGNDPVVIEYSASATGSGEDILRDLNNDGQVDGYVQNRSSYDVLYYSITRTFDWISDRNDFEIRETHVDMPEYPGQIQDVLFQYLSLRVMQEENSPEINQRLSELCSSPQANDIKIEADQWSFALYDYLMGFGDRIIFDIKESHETATATVTALDDESNKVMITFEFELVKIDDRWGISELNLISEPE
jgi:hypothetical protein